MSRINVLGKLVKNMDIHNTYFNKHAGDVLGSVFYIIAFALLFIYLSIKKRNIIIRREWPIHKCKPEITPFAGFINPPPDATFDDKIDFTVKNYAACNISILEKNMKAFTTPLDNMQNMISSLFKMAQEAIMKIRSIYAVLQDRFLAVVQLIMAKLFQIGISVQIILLNIKDTFAKTAGVLQGSFLLVVTQAFIFITFLNSLIFQMVIGLLIMTAVMYLLFMAGAGIIWIPVIGPIVAPPIITMGITVFLAYIVSVILLLIVIVFLAILQDYLKKQDAATCFNPNTKIKLQSGKYEIMKNLNLGDILEDGTIVKGIFRIKGNEKNKYYKIYSEKLEDYIYVTGTHLILHPYKKKYIKVENYEKAQITNLWGNELSCLVTSTNKIPIGEYTFWDWED